MLVDKDATSAADIGTYSVPIKLQDDYEYGANSNLFFLKIKIGPVEKPYYVFTPRNAAPYFDSALTEEQVTFNVEESWEFLLPNITDPDRDKYFIAVNTTDTPFI